MLKCDKNEKCSKSKILRKSTKQGQGKHGSLQLVEVWSGVMEELAFSADQPHQARAIYHKRENWIIW